MSMPHDLTPPVVDPLAPELAALEAERRRIARISLAGGIGVVALVAATIWINDALVTFLAIVAGLIAWMVLQNTSGGAYPAAYKRVVVAAVARRFAPGLRYDPQSDFTRDDFARSRFAPGVDMGELVLVGFEASDGLVGKVGDRPWRLAHVHAAHQRRHRFTTIFIGLFGVTALEEPCPGHVVLLPDFGERWLGAAGLKLQALDSSRGELVHFNDAAFEKAFVVHASEEALARRYLTPHVRERLTLLAATCPGRLSISLVGNRLFVGLQRSGGFFAPLLKGRAGNPKPIAELAEALSVVLSLPITLGVEH